MENVLKLINEYEARNVDIMYFTSDEYKIYLDELEAFKEFGYYVVYLGFNNRFLSNRFSIAKIK